MSRLIDADPLIEQMDAEPEGGYYSPHDVISLLMAQPVVEERKTGKWEQDNPFTKPRCSECGKTCFGLHGFDYTLTPFCPNCGADMRGEGHE